VEARYYPLVGRAVISILGEVLGPEHFTREKEQAWVKAHAEISQAMVAPTYRTKAPAEAPRVA
jgi:hemoglobin-like flavoprotein